MRTITNNYRDAHILNLGSARQSGPYLVTQTGVSPNDVLPKERMFVLRPDGHWVDFNAYACKDKPEAMDEIVSRTILIISWMSAKLVTLAPASPMALNEKPLKEWLQPKNPGIPPQAVQ